jgi:hypothetical protein|tara:strand:+ start:1167 stop:1340 length:174 start_codon:yes stop_codon:yes gene_type:complete
MSQNEIDCVLEAEYVMTWMGLIIETGIHLDDATLGRCFQLLIAHLESHIDTLATEKA